MNTLHERAYDERTTHPTVQISTPARRVLSIREPYATGVKSQSILRRLSHHAIIKLVQSTREMIVMVVQPRPVEGKVARWHCVPGGADLLPADVSPLSRDIIFNSLVAYSMGTGRTRMAPGQRTEKDGGKDRSEKTVWSSGFRNALGGLLFHLFPVGNVEIGNVKN